MWWQQLWWSPLPCLVMAQHIFFCFISSKSSQLKQFSAFIWISGLYYEIQSVKITGGQQVFRIDVKNISRHVLSRKLKPVHDSIWAYKHLLAFQCNVIVNVIFDMCQFLNNRLLILKFPPLLPLSSPFSHCSAHSTDFHYIMVIK